MDATALFRHGKGHYFICRVLHPGHQIVHKISKVGKAETSLSLNNWLAFVYGGSFI